MNELKPCPFCGGEAEVRQYISFDETDSGEGMYSVGCYTDKCMGEYARNFYFSEDEAIEAWNTRASETQLLAEMQTRVWIAERQRNEAMAALMDEGISVPLYRTCRNTAPVYLDFLCSECGCVHYHSDENDSGDGNEWNYCPNCGARVLGKQSNTGTEVGE